MIGSWMRYHVKAKYVALPNCVPLCPLISFIFGFGFASEKSDVPKDDEPGTDKVFKSRLYWSTKPITDIIIEADNLFTTGNFLAVYEFLNRLKFHNNAEIQWRISRALFKLSGDQSLSLDLRNEMINEAYLLMTATMNLEENNPNVYKWMAIILDAKCGLEGLHKRVESFETVKKYLLKAVELNPRDAVSFYMLGKYCFEMANMSLTERMISRLFYGTVEQSTYQEAYDHLVKACEIYPEAYYIPNYFLLGRTCYYMNQFYRARYYLSTASTLPPRNKFETQCANQARMLLKRLDIYDLTKASFSVMEPFTI